MLHSGWMLLALVALVGGVAVILFPRELTQLNGQLNQMLVSMDDAILKHRHMVGTLLLIVAYLCFRLAALMYMARSG